MTNNFYNKTETCKLPVKELTVEGEIANTGKVDLSTLQKRSVIVKETLLSSSGANKFVGAYRYDGYSLFDILEKRVPEKENSHEFERAIDMYVEIENEEGEKVLFSWGEIYYPYDLHKILIADAVSRIVPSKTKDLWELPAESKIVAGNDLITERNISSPVKITVRSFPKWFRVIKGLTPMFSKTISIYSNSNLIETITDYPPGYEEINYNTIFYGRGRGIHSTQPFKGMMVKEILAGKFPLSRDFLQKWVICVSGEDGYRCAITYSELFNRNDQQEFLLVKTDQGEDGGLFRIFPAADFFSDRAVKSVKEIHFRQ